MRATLTLAFLASAGMASIVAAKPMEYVLPPETATLRPGPAAGLDAAKRNCLGCHSPDYISTQPPKKGQAFWEAEVAKMRAVYHAPIDDEDAKAIAAYLTESY
ncbi:cytochrome c [Rhodopila sp.]|jgi:mono/diheme cytochrome c family protein|uniref:SorB family sulfite dehydrogenase c-type cytochrome subunit n=1 Tax=Rhodopila sp. TaxID=2480087 RepID=UPI002BCDD38E|nr:cytochrome c [Rhodopila sp.]HVZ08624.1 cytochrome c [Rhodopila sp.]